MSSPSDEESDSSTNSVEDDEIKLVQLKMQFHSTRREDFQTIEAYVEKLKSISDSLAKINSQISDSDMVLQLLAGLPIQYLPLKNTISSKSPLPKFEEACSILYMQEDILLQDDVEKITSDPGVGGAEQSSTFDTVLEAVDTVLEAVDTVYATYCKIGTVVTVLGALGVGTVIAGPLGGVTAVRASRMIAVGATSAVAGWKLWQMRSRK